MTDQADKKKIMITGMTLSELNDAGYRLKKHFGIVRGSWYDPATANKRMEKQASEMFPEANTIIMNKTDASTKESAHQYRASGEAVIISGGPNKG